MKMRAAFSACMQGAGAGLLVLAVFYAIAGESMNLCGLLGIMSAACWSVGRLFMVR